jgi:hypothetical protein
MKVDRRLEMVLYRSSSPLHANFRLTYCNPCMCYKCPYNTQNNVKCCATVYNMGVRIDKPPPPGHFSCPNNSEWVFLHQIHSVGLITQHIEASERSGPQFNVLHWQVRLNSVTWDAKGCTTYTWPAIHYSSNERSRAQEAMQLVNSWTSEYRIWRRKVVTILLHVFHRDMVSEICKWI